MNAAAMRGGKSQDPATGQPGFLASPTAAVGEPDTPSRDEPGTDRARPAVPFPCGVFISYRRSDTGPYARLLKEHLSDRLPGVQVFMDLDSIEAGLDFEEVIRGAVSSCPVVVALIGPRWVTVAGEDGRRRIDDPGDYVRFEIATALERGVRVIPVLVDGAKPLRLQQLPPGLEHLARLSALEMSYDRFAYDEARLTALIERVLAACDGRQYPGAVARRHPGTLFRVIAAWWSSMRPGR